MFEVNACRFEVQGRCLLEASGLCFEEGKVYGLIGHNGSGKSTLLKLLARQQCASCGEICLNGRAVDSWGNREFARNVAYLPQHLPSAESLTVRELVAFGRYPWHGLFGRLSKKDKAQVQQAMERTQTDGFAEHATPYDKPMHGLDDLFYMLRLQLREERVDDLHHLIDQRLRTTLSVMALHAVTG